MEKESRPWSTENKAGMGLEEVRGLEERQQRKTKTRTKEEVRGEIRLNRGKILDCSNLEREQTTVHLNP